MSTSLELTLDVLAATNNSAADQLLSMMVAEEQANRRPAIRALLRRKTRFGAAQVLKIWDELTDDEIRTVQDHSTVMSPVVEEMLKGEIGTKDWDAALDALRMLSLSQLLPLVIELLEGCFDRQLRNRMLATVLELGSALGDAARSGREQPSVRLPVVNRLAESVRHYNRHRCSGLFEAFLVASAWGDRELRLMLQEDFETMRRLAEPLATSVLPGVINLVAGYIRRRTIPDIVRRALESRSDSDFRESLLNYVGHSPSRMTLKNLANLGVLESLRDWRNLGAQTAVSLHSALVFAHTTNSTEFIPQITVILDVIARGSRRADTAVVAMLSRCKTPDEQEWLKAAIEITRTNLNAISENPLAQILWRILQLIDHPDPSVVAALRSVLSPLKAEGILRNIHRIPETNHSRLGGLVRRIDPQFVAVVGDELRCPVLERRMRAIKVAQVCDMVDEVGPLLMHAAINDHRDARLAAIASLALANDDRSLEALRQIAEGPVGALRDAAERALQNRNTMAKKEENDLLLFRRQPEEENLEQSLSGGGQ